MSLTGHLAHASLGCSDGLRWQTGRSCCLGAWRLPPRTITHDDMCKIGGSVGSQTGRTV